MSCLKLWSDNRGYDDIDLEAQKDPEAVMTNLIEDIKVLKEFHEPMFETVKLVAHIGVDFGYGKFNLSDDHIKNARVLLEDIQGDKDE